MSKYSAEYWDHRRDLEKHEPRATDPVKDHPVLGTYTEPKRAAAPIDAIEIAVLVKGMSNITEAARLIDQYAATVAAGAKLEGVQQVYDRIDDLLPKVSA